MFQLGSLVPHLGQGPSRRRSCVPRMLTKTTTNSCPATATHTLYTKVFIAPPPIFLTSLTERHRPCIRVWPDGTEWAVQRLQLMTSGLRWNNTSLVPDKEGYDGTRSHLRASSIFLYINIRADPGQRGDRTKVLLSLLVILQAEKIMLEKGENKEYPPVESLTAFNKLTAELLLGTDHPVIQQKKVATVQSLSGLGSIRLASAFIQRNFPDAQAIIPSPTWVNHKIIFDDAGVPWSEYRYYEPKTVSLDFDGMISDIKAAPDGLFIVLHGCAKNPTGIGPTPQQWEKIADGIQEKKHIPFFLCCIPGIEVSN